MLLGCSALLPRSSYEERFDERRHPAGHGRYGNDSKDVFALVLACMDINIHLSVYLCILI